MAVTSSTSSPKPCGMLWGGSDLKAHLIAIPCHGQGHLGGRLWYKSRAVCECAESLGEWLCSSPTPDPREMIPEQPRTPCRKHSDSNNVPGAAGWTRESSGNL